VRPYKHPFTNQCTQFYKLFVSFRNSYVFPRESLRMAPLSRNMSFLQIYVVCNSVTCTFVGGCDWLLEYLASQNLILTQNIMKIQLSLSTPWRQIGGAEVWLHSFLTSALDEGQRSVSRPVHFNPGIGPRYQWRPVGGFSGVQTPPPEIPKFWQSW
jgi:hypothetical protein